MKELIQTKAVIVKGKSKSGNDYYALKVWLTSTYSTFIILQNGDKELVREKYDKDSNLENTDSNV